MKYFCATICLLLASAVTGADAADPNVAVETLDARTIEGRLASISTEAVTLTVGDEIRNVPRRDIAEISLANAADLMGRLGQGVVVTDDGEPLAGGDLTAEAGRLRFTNPMLGEVTLAMDRLRAIYLPQPGYSARHTDREAKRRGLSADRNDVLLVARERQPWTSADGVFKSLSPVPGGAPRVVFAWGGKDRTIAAEKVAAIFLASPIAKPGPRRGVLVGRCGSRASFSSVQSVGESLKVDFVEFGQRTIPRKLVAAVRFESDRVVDLSRLTPAEVVEHGYLDEAFPYRSGRCVTGGPIHLGGRTYQVGLGLHSFCQLTYDLGGRYSMFVTLVGIDESSGDLGDAALTVLVDGEISQKLRLTSKSPPQTVRVKVAGAERLTIRVDFGCDGLAVGDRVDLAEPRLIK